MLAYFRVWIWQHLQNYVRNLHARSQQYSNLKHGDYITPHKGTDVVKRTVYLTVKKFLEFYAT